MVFDTLALAVNDEFHYPRFFQTMPYGPKGKEAITAGYFAAAATIEPKPKTMAMTGADAEFSKNAMAGAREHAKKAGLQIVYDKNYPPNTIDYTPDRARDQGDQPGPRIRRVIPGRQRRHPARGRGAGADREDVRRPGHRAAIRLDQAADGRAPERHRRLRIVRARADDEFPRRR